MLSSSLICRCQDFSGRSCGTNNFTFSDEYTLPVGRLFPATAGIQVLGACTHETVQRSHVQRRRGLPRLHRSERTTPAL